MTGVLPMQQHLMLFLYLFNILCVVCMFVCCVHGWYLQRPAEDTGSLELGSQIVANCLGVLGLESTSSEEQPVLLTAHPSLQPQTTVLGPGLYAASSSAIRYADYIFAKLQHF